MAFTLSLHRLTSKTLTSDSSRAVQTPFRTESRACRAMRGIDRDQSVEVSGEMKSVCGLTVASIGLPALIDWIAEFNLLPKSCRTMIDCWGEEELVGKDESLPS